MTLKSKKRNVIPIWFSIGLIFILLIPVYQKSFSTINESIVITKPKVGEFIREENLTLTIYFMGLKEELINIEEIESQLYDTFERSVINPHAKYTFNFQFEFASELAYTNLKTYIESIAVNGTGTGYTLNVTQLLDDLNTGNRNEIFIPQDGMAIDAELVEEYIYQNLYQAPPIDNPGYSFFLLNFSQFDSPDHVLEHWYDTSSVSSDHNSTVTWWYAGYGDLEKRAAMGWGGKYRFCYLDLSAYSWYIDYVKNAWSNFGIGNYLYYQYLEIDKLAQAYDFNTSLGKDKLTQYLKEWINSYTSNVFSGPCYDPQIGKSISLQVKVFNNLTDNGYTFDDIRWCISDYRIKQQLDLDFPWMDWRIEVEWVELDEYPGLFNFIQENIQEDVNGRYLEVIPDFFEILYSQLDFHFNLTAADVVLPCYYFLTDDIQFKADGISFAGLGGMGWEILLGSQYSIFEDGNANEPRRGMTQVMIHELGHSLGLPHPHTGTGWGSSFVADVMSYFSTKDSFSSFYKDGVDRAHTDANYYFAQNEYFAAWQAFVEAGQPEAVAEEIAVINSMIESVPIHYQSMEYQEAISQALLARELIELFYIHLQESFFSTTTSPTQNTSNYSIVILLPITWLVIHLYFKRKISHQLTRKIK
ncbi:MAG: hypothetical protein FK734_06580 [Asgard group archaeon]|nr:hypothetical protein [Asgard group archaeon]